MRLVTNSLRARFSVDLNNQIEVVMFRCPFAKLQHLRKFVGRVDVQYRERNASKEGFASEPDQNIGVFAHRPRHGDVLEGVICLAKNKNALILEVVEMSALHWCNHFQVGAGSSEPPATRSLTISERAIEVNRPCLKLRPLSNWCDSACALRAAF